MSGPSSRQDPALSAASFLASIGAESSVAFGSDASTASASSAPSLPISAKVALIDAQIDSLETRIEQSVTAHADKLRERAASTRTVDHDLNQLWRSINQTSARLVTVGPQLGPIASQYHDALAQSSKQGLLISVLSDLLAATRQLEQLEKHKQQSDWSTLKAQLPAAAKALQPFSSSPELQGLPAVVELRARFDRLHREPAGTRSKSRSADLKQTIPADRTLTASEKSDKEPANTVTARTEQTLTPASKVLEAARVIIVSRGPEAGWKGVRIELDAPAPPPPVITAPVSPPEAAHDGSNRTSLDSRPEHLLREQLMPASVSLSRNSSSSSTAANARSRHKPKLGARVIRPQDQLGSGPFNAEDTPLDGDGWGLDDDDEDISAPPQATAQPLSHTSLPSHNSVASLPHEERSSTPGSSGMMQRSISSSSSTAFAVQEAAPHGGASKSDNVDAWGLGEEENQAEGDAWDRGEHNASHQPQTPAKKSPVASLKVTPGSHARHISSTDAWGLREDEADLDDDAWETQQPKTDVATTSDATSIPALKGDTLPASTSAEDPWEAADKRGLAQSDEAKTHVAIAASAPQVHREVTVPTIREAVHASTPATQSQAVETPTQSPSDPATNVAKALEQDDGTHKAVTQIPADEAASQPATIGEVRAPSPPTTQSVDPSGPEQAEQEIEDETDVDAWGFEEGSSASEGDRVEIAKITPLQEAKAPAEPPPASSTVQAAERPAAKTETAQPPSTVRSVKPNPNKVVIPQTREAEPTVSPPSPTGWGDDFSDTEPTQIPASASRDSIRREAGNSASSMRSISAGPKAHASSPAKQVAKLPDPTPMPAATLKEDCTISQRSLDLIKLAETTMDSVLSKLQAARTAATEADQDEIEALAGTIFKIFELHRALMPVAHGEVLRDVPSLAMQFFNDCEYLARELSRLIVDKGEAITTAWASYDAEGARRWSTKELAKLEQEAASTRGLGQRWFEAQMTAQTKILLDTLMEADGFARTFDEQRFARCERCIKQVVHTLQQLAKAWRPVLVASRFQAAIGRLVDLVFQKVLHDVLDLEDIGESESEKIASLVKTLGSLESLFTVASGSEQQSAAALWVPSWFKTSYLIEILTGSLVDIEFLAFEAGALVDYSRKELTGLIKALFADTPNRSKLLRRIESAPVEVLAH